MSDEPTFKTVIYRENISDPSLPTLDVVKVRVRATSGIVLGKWTTRTGDQKPVVDLYDLPEYVQYVAAGKLA